jgi:hypothetical protein
VSAARWAVLLGLIFAFPADAAAQGRRSGSFSTGISAGPRVGRDFGNKTWLVGGQVQVPVGERLELRPSGDLLFRKGERMGWQVNGDGAIHFGQGGGLYAGGGIAFARLAGDADTETGYNLFVGLSTAAPDEPTKGFVEFRWTFLDGTSPFRIALGFLYRL